MDLTGPNYSPAKRFKNKAIQVRYQVLMAANVNMPVFWDVSEMDRTFGGAYCFHHQGHFVNKPLTKWIVGSLFL
jgi:hypothetical protein